MEEFYRDEGDEGDMEENQQGMQGMQGMKGMCRNIFMDVVDSPQKKRR